MSDSPFKRHWDKDPLRSHWDEDPDWLVSDWKDEVRNDDTRQGYHEWVVHNKEIQTEDDVIATFDVIISDKDGLWGSVKLRAEDGTAAEKLAYAYIEEMVRLGDTDADLPTASFAANKLTTTKDD